MSKIEEIFLSQMKTLCLPAPEREQVLAPPDGWLIDFMWRAERLIVELDGHPSHMGSRFTRDCEKQNEAVLRGWRYLRCSYEMVYDGRAASFVSRAFKAFGAEEEGDCRPPLKYVDRAAGRHRAESRLTLQHAQEQDKPMPTAERQQTRNPIPAGDQFLTLVSVEEKDMPSFNDAAVMTKRWVWQFKAKMKDPETGERYEYRKFTGPKYGNVRAELTILLDMMFPDMDEEEKGSINTDDHLGTGWKAKFRHDKAEKQGDPPKPVLIFIEPYVKATTAAPATRTARPAPVEEEVEDDPFSDE